MKNEINIFFLLLLRFILNLSLDSCSLKLYQTNGAISSCYFSSLLIRRRFFFLAFGLFSMSQFCHSTVENERIHSFPSVSVFLIFSVLFLSHEKFENRRIEDKWHLLQQHLWIFTLWRISIRAKEYLLYLDVTLLFPPFALPTLTLSTSYWLKHAWHSFECLLY